MSVVKQENANTKIVFVRNLNKMKARALSLILKLMELALPNFHNNTTSNNNNNKSLLLSKDKVVLVPDY